MIKLCSAQKISEDDLKALSSGRVQLMELLRTRKLSPTALRRVRAALAALDDLERSPNPGKSEMERVSRTMRRVATSEEIYPAEVRDRREEEHLDMFSTTREPGGQKQERSMMPVADGGKTVEILPFWRDEPQNRAGHTRSQVDPTKVAEDIMVYLDREIYNSAQEAFDGHVQEGGPYHLASFDQKKALVTMLRSYALVVKFDEDEAWALDNRRRKNNRTIGYGQAEPKDRLPLALGQQESAFRTEDWEQLKELVGRGVSDDRIIAILIRNFGMREDQAWGIVDKAKSAVSAVRKDNVEQSPENFFDERAADEDDKPKKDKKDDDKKKDKDKKDIRTKLPPYMTPSAKRQAKKKKKRKHKKQTDYGASPPQPGEGIAIPGGPPGSAPSAGGGAAAIRLSSFVRT